MVMQGMVTEGNWLGWQRKGDGDARDGNGRELIWATSKQQVVVYFYVDVVLRLLRKSVIASDGAPVLRGHLGVHMSEVRAFVFHTVRDSMQHAHTKSRSSLFSPFCAFNHVSSQFIPDLYVLVPMSPIWWLNSYVSLTNVSYTTHLSYTTKFKHSRMHGMSASLTTTFGQIR